jgi:hypothetical protein
MICQSLHGLGRTLWWRGDLTGAETTLRNTLACAEEIGLDPARSDLMGVKGDLADVLAARGQLDPAIPLAREALAGLEAADRDGIIPEAKIRLGELLSLRDGTRAEGVRLLEEGRLGAAGLGRFGRRHVRRALVALAGAAAAGGELDAAWCLLEEARALDSALAPGDPARGAVARRLAELQAPAGASAAPAIRDCAAIETRLRGPGTDPG